MTRRGDLRPRSCTTACLWDRAGRASRFAPSPSLGRSGRASHLPPHAGKSPEMMGYDGGREDGWGQGAPSLCVKRTRKAHEPMKVDHSEAASQAGEEPLAKPRAPQRVNPSAPMRFQSPMCHPSVLGEGVCQFGCVSSMKSHEEIMKPVPPTTLCVGIVLSVCGLFFLSGGHWDSFQWEVMA